MHSRAVLLLSLLALACLIVIGSVTLHLTSASASTNGTSGDRARQSTIDQNAGRSESSNLSVFRDPDQADAGDANAAADLSFAERASADSLQMLLREVHVRFDPMGSDVSNGMIPYLAEMITVINQHDHLVYRIELNEPDEALARLRAQTLNDVLRLNILEPSNLRIVGRQGLHSTRVDVSVK